MKRELFRRLHEDKITREPSRHERQVFRPYDKQVRVQAADWERRKAEPQRKQGRELRKRT